MRMRATRRRRIILALAFAALVAVALAGAALQLIRGERPDSPAGADGDDGDVRLRRHAPNASRDALETIDLTLAGECNAPQAAASISSRAVTNCSSVSRMCEC